MIDYNIISTGSKGNATVINNSILIDAGVPFKALQPFYKDLQLVLLTHEHGDHFNRATIKKLAQMRPSLRFGCCEWLVDPLIKCDVDKRNIDVFCVDADHIYAKDLANPFIVEPFSLPHNVPNCGYIISSSKFGRLIYATDTSDISHVHAPNFDLYLIEANHTEDGIQERIQAKLDAGEYVYEYAAMQNHLSKEKCDAWLLKNMGNKSEFVYMHGHDGG